MACGSQNAICTSETFNGGWHNQCFPRIPLPTTLLRIKNNWHRTEDESSLDFAMDQAIDQLENGVLMLSAIRFKMHVLFLTTTQVGHFFVATGMAVVARLDLPASSARWGGKRQMARLHFDFCTFVCIFLLSFIFNVCIFVIISFSLDCSRDCISNKFGLLAP